MTSLPSTRGPDREEAASPRASRGAFRAVGALVAGEAVNKAARFAASVVLARSLTLEEFGFVNVGIAVSGVLAIAASLGLPDYGARVAATQPERIRSLVASVVAVRVLALVTLTAAAAGVTALITPESTGIVLLAAAMAVGVSVSLDWTLRGQDRMRPVAIATGAGGTLLLVLSLTAVVALPTTLVALAVFAVAELATAGMTWYAARVSPMSPGSARQLRSLVRQAWPLAVTATIVYAYSANVDTILLSALRSPQEAGLYSAPYRLFLAGTALGIFAGYAFLPRLARAIGTSDESIVVASFARSLTVLCAYGVLLVGLTEIAGQAALGLIFGPAFETMRETFILLFVALPWYVIGFPVGYTLIARGRERRFLRGAAVAGALNLALNVMLIPAFGAEGAAVATTLAFIAATLIWLREHDILSAPRPLLATLVALSLGATVAASLESVSAFVGCATALVGMLILRGVKTSQS